MTGFRPPGLGWTRSVPDFRDYTIEHPGVKRMLGRLKRMRARRPQAVDLSEFLPAAYDQGNLNSSTAQACAALDSYFERRAHGRLYLPSRLFLYKVARKLLQLSGDTGADLRTTLKAMKTFGMPPERYHPHETERFDDEPDGFAYGFTHSYRKLVYVRLDERDASGSRTLDVVRAFLAAGFPVAFGFAVPDSIGIESDVPYRPTFDGVIGGQAVVAVGYDDRRLVTTRGALLIRNSWGTGWGDEGYGWLPYAYVEEKLAAGFWSLLRNDWLKSGEFRQPKC